MSYKISAKAQEDLINIWEFTFENGHRNKPTGITI